MYFFRKKDPNRPTNFNLKVMHAINAIAITVFLLGIIWKLIQWFILKKWAIELLIIVGSPNKQHRQPMHIRHFRKTNNYPYENSN